MISISRLRFRLRQGAQEELAGWLFASPWIIGFLIFTLGPMLYSLGMSFTNYDLFRWQWVGINNFAPMGPASANGFTKSNGWGIPKGTKNADLSWAFIEWWYSDETQTKFAEMGELVPRSDLRDAVALKSLPEHLRPALLTASKNARSLERFPGWDVGQRNWKNELDVALTSDVSVAEAMQTADKKADAEIADLMTTVCQ